MKLITVLLLATTATFLGCDEKQAEPRQKLNVAPLGYQLTAKQGANYRRDFTLSTIHEGFRNTVTYEVPANEYQQATVPIDSPSIFTMKVLIKNQPPPFDPAVSSFEVTVTKGRDTLLYQSNQVVGTNITVSKLFPPK